MLKPVKSFSTAILLSMEQTTVVVPIPEIVIRNSNNNLIEFRGYF